MNPLFKGSLTLIKLATTNFALHTIFPVQNSKCSDEKTTKQLDIRDDEADKYVYLVMHELE